MGSFSRPDPVLDAREIALIKDLTERYLQFRKPGPIAKAMSGVSKFIAKITPSSWSDLASNATRAASESEIIKRAFTVAGKGFGTAIHHNAKWLVLDSGKVVSNLSELGHVVPSYNHVCALRSYWIEKHVGSKDYKHLILALVEGGVTGAPGLIGVPFNIALSFLLFFRATQSVAMYYGYDVRSDPRELEIAQVTLECLAPGTIDGEECLGGLLGKMMLIGELAALKTFLKKPFSEMITKGGLSLFYVQLRALANKAAEKALQKSGEKSLEFGIFRNLLEQVAKLLPKAATSRAIPLFQPSLVPV